MKFKNGKVVGSYDERFDILYIYYEGRDYSYGEEDPDDFVTFKSINTNELTGYLVYNFKDRLDKDALDISEFDPTFRNSIYQLIASLQK